MSIVHTFPSRVNTKRWTRYRRNVQPLFGLIVILSLLSFPSACTSRGFTKPRSQIIDESKEEGRFARSSAQERARFFGVQEENRRRLESLIAQRSMMDLSGDDYVLGPGDVLEISVFDVPELNVTAKVRDSGFLSLPLIGGIPVNGQTERSFEAELRQKLGEFVIDPQASVTVSEYGSQRVSVLGAVNEPGTYALRRGQNSLLELIGEAGGISDKAGNYLNFVPREQVASRQAGYAFSGQSRGQLGVSAYGRNVRSGSVQVRSSASTKGESDGTEILLEEVFGTSGEVPIHIPVLGGDMIIVPEAGKVLVEGEVERRGSYDLSQRMTLLGALASAGGITYGAKYDEIEIVRSVTPYERAHLVLSLEEIMSGKESDVPLRNGDIVRVPSDEGRRMKQDTFEGFSKLINVGVGGSYNLSP